MSISGNYDNYKMETPHHFIHEEDEEVFIKCDLCLIAFRSEEIKTREYYGALIHACEYCCINSRL